MSRTVVPGMVKPLNNKRRLTGGITGRIEKSDFKQGKKG